MMRSEAITIIKRGLGFRQTQDSAIIAALKQAQRDFESGKTLPTWLLAFDQPITFTAGGGSAGFTLPTGFLRLHDDYDMYYVTPTGGKVYLPRKNFQEAFNAYANSAIDQTALPEATAAYPQVAVYQSNTVGRFFPVPTTSFTAYLTAYKAAQTLDSELENAWLKYAADYLIGTAGLQVAGDLRDRGAADKFSMMMKMGAQAFFAGVIDAELAGRPLVMGRNN